MGEFEGELVFEQESPWSRLKRPQPIAFAFQDLLSVAVGTFGADDHGDHDGAEMGLGHAGHGRERGALAGVARELGVDEERMGKSGTAQLLGPAKADRIVGGHHVGQARDDRVEQDRHAVGVGDDAGSAGWGEHNRDQSDGQVVEGETGAGLGRWLDAEPGHIDR